MIEEQNVSNVILAGDFNADPNKGRFWKMLTDFCSSLSLVVLDHLFPVDTFTYLCPTRDSTSWLDHIICTEAMSGSVANVFLDYTMALFDHFPVCFTLDIPIMGSPSGSMGCDSNEFVNWNKITVSDRKEIKNFIDKEITNQNLLYSHALLCYDKKCEDENHLQDLDRLVQKCKTILHMATKNYCFANRRCYRVVPGWNDSLKQLHCDARKCFLAWKSKGKPMNGRLYDDMKLSRTHFKSALKSCKRNENHIRSKKLLDNLNNKNNTLFWNEVRKINNHNLAYPSRIDNNHTDEGICNMFSKKYKCLFNKNHSGLKNIKRTNVSEKKKVEIILRFSKEDILRGITKLKVGIGCDMIHSNHLKFSPPLFVELLTELFNSFILHGYIPNEILKGVITPLVKDKLGNISSSNNYRPVMSSSVFLKLFEYCLQEKIDPYIDFNDRQHGFRKTYSTSTACLVLKETILQYANSGSDVYACFLDISKAFDSVNHNILMNKLSNSGVPACLVNIAKYWYSHQFVKVRYNSSLSEEWRITNGVRQGGVLSSLFFNLYIDSLICQISDLNIGCKLGIMSSNIIVYADDIVILAPSLGALQYLLDIINVELLDLSLNINQEKTKIMRFLTSKSKLNKSASRSFKINGQLIECVNSIKYLGFIITSNLNITEDINRVKSKFYIDFNSILRKFSFTDTKVKLFLFKQYCLQFYGCELWFGCSMPSQAIRQFEIGFHKAIKKLLCLSTNESNHYACQEANILMFGHFINKIKIRSALRFLTKPCSFIAKIRNFYIVSSVMYRDIRKILFDQYQVDSLLDNEFEAIFSRISFVQCHETQMRDSW